MTLVLQRARDGGRPAHRLLPRRDLPRADGGPGGPPRGAALARPVAPAGLYEDAGAAAEPGEPDAAPLRVLSRDGAFHRRAFALYSAAVARDALAPDRGQS